MKNNEEKINEIRNKYNKIKEYLNEKTRRIWAWTEAISLWKWWITILKKATWLNYRTIKRWIEESKITDKEAINDKVRKEWWWRKTIIEKNKNIEQELEKLLEPNTRWDPMSPLLRTSKSTYNLAKELVNLGFKICQKSVCGLLKNLWYSLQSNKKVNEWWKENPDRNEQFEFIYAQTKNFQEDNQPVISVDTKKKENIWNFKNNWLEYHKKWDAPEVKVHDFVDKELWKVSPYWIYDISENNGFVNVWISSDTAEFAVESISQWRIRMWIKKYLNAKKIYITADWWWSNGSRVRLWKVELQKFANEFNLEVNVSHFPPWTSKWNKIEHKMFSFITKNWRWKPLIDRVTVVNLIANTKTEKWLKIEARLDEKEYLKWINVSDEEFANINIIRSDFHWEWNYTILPNNM